jgi:hypothetical protein
MSRPKAKVVFENVGFRGKGKGLYSIKGRVEARSTFVQYRRHEKVKEVASTPFN